MIVELLVEELVEDVLIVVELVEVLVEVVLVEVLVVISVVKLTVESIKLCVELSLDPWIKLVCPSYVVLIIGVVESTTVVDNNLVEEIIDVSIELVACSV